MRQHARPPGWDKLAFAAALQITLLEGTEVVFIVIGIGAGGPGLLAPASFGAFIALALVALLGLALHRPLANVPENTLKFIVGGLLCGFGTFWTGAGIGLAWPGSDAALLWLAAGFLIAGYLAVPFCRKAAPRRN
jgi:uncharacterized membrane protein